MKHAATKLGVGILVLAICSSTLHADVNVLIIGSEKDSVESRRVRGKSQAFSPAGIKTHLEKILGGAGLGSVNVVLKDRCRAGSDADLNARLDASLRLHQKIRRLAKPPQLSPSQRENSIKRMRLQGNPCYSLASWFHWPYPEGAETQTRWPNLRGEKGTKWDYVVLIGDPYTIEHLPGLYTHGVAKIAEEVAKGKGKTILLMGWPGANSESTVRHYKEVVYRTGRTGSMMVAPAALAWEAAGKPRGEAHPSADGAYIAAASIYSRIWKKSASKSTHRYKGGLADKVHKMVMANVGAKQYSGRLEFPNAFAMFGNSGRSVRPRKSPGGSSTESGLVQHTSQAIARAGATAGGGASYRIGRDSGSPTRGKDYRLGDKEYKGTTFAYRYQTNTGNPDIHLAQIFSQDINLADQVMNESKTYRAIPRRLMWASLHQADPKIKPMSSHGHLSHEASVACGGFVYTIISGRCPIGPKPDPITRDWLSQKVGYEVAWQLATGQSRAPGFKVTPSSEARHTVDPEKPETMAVQFLLPPRKNVIVTVSTNDASNMAVSPATLTFTPDNYNVPQKVVVKVADGISAGTQLKVHYATRSDDEVYDALSDSWDYHVNAPPVANGQTATGYSGRVADIVLTGSDPDQETLSYSVVKQPTNGTLAISPEGIAAYDPKAGFAGADRFTFRSNDGSVYSKPATVTVTVQKPTLYNFNLLLNSSGELKPFEKYNWVAKEGKWKQSTPVSAGVFSFGVDASKAAELHQDVDVRKYAKAIRAGKQPFKISGSVDKSNDDVRVIVEFRDGAGVVLRTYDTAEKDSVSKKKRFEATELAPANTASIRVRLRSVNKGGRGNGGRFDGLSLIAVKP